MEIALSLLVLAAGLHAAWNIVMKTSGDPLGLATRAMTWSAVLSTPLVGVTWLVAGRPGMPLGGWVAAVLSGGVETAYFLGLSEAYRRGELSVVYPIARGTAPALAALVGLTLLHERVTAPGVAGIALLLAGIWVVRRPGSGGNATFPALLTGVCIAGYTSIDKVGVGYAAPWLYGWALWCVTALLLFLWSVRPQRDSQETSEALSRRTVIGAGIMMAATYVAVLIALRLAPLSSVAPLRESAIVLVTLWSIRRLGERDRAWLRLAGASAIVAGAGLLVIG